MRSTPQPSLLKEKEGTLTNQVIFVGASSAKVIAGVRDSTSITASTRDRIFFMWNPPLRFPALYFSRPWAERNGWMGPQPLMAPIMMPLVRNFWIKGYRQRIGTVDMIMVA